MDENHPKHGIGVSDDAIVAAALSQVGTADSPIGHGTASRAVWNGVPAL